jgi:uncharacterized membrane protein required for colicin V production
MCLAVLAGFAESRKFNYFDVFAAVWLIIGLFRGRKRGMSQELLPLLQWIGILTVGGLLYFPFGDLVRHYTMFDRLWCNLTAYILIAFGVHLLYLWLKQLSAEKLSEKDFFGNGEFYLGMISGVVRFACMLLVVMALMNSRLVTAAELAKTEKFQKDNFSDIRFPTYGQVQRDVLFGSYTGDWVEHNLKPLLIASVGPPEKPKPSQTIAERSNKTLDDILGKPAK